MKERTQRRLSGLLQVEACTPPAFAAKSKLSGMAAKGKTYERRVGVALKRLVEDGEVPGELWLGPWFKYTDANGAGLAQPDALILQTDGIVIIEAKLKQTVAALPQIELYGGLAKSFFGLPWRGVAVFKFPTLKRNKDWLETLDMVCSKAEYTTSHWHFLG